MSPPTRLFALLDPSKVTDDARAFFQTTVPFGAILILVAGTRRPPWMLMGITPGGGSVGHLRFPTLDEAKRAAEYHFASVMGEWQEPPRDRNPQHHVASLLPGYIDWRIGTGPVETAPLYRAKLRFAEYEGQSGHEHCAFCWQTFFVQTHEPPRRGERESLQFGFRSDDGNTWVCEDCYFALRDILELDAELG